LGIAILGDNFLNGTLEEQRGAIAQQLTSVVDQAFEEHCQRVSDRLHHLYSQLIQDTKHQQSVWESAKNTALRESSLVGANETEWRQMIEASDALRAEIIVALGTFAA
jgi:hypothetical protein